MTHYECDRCGMCLKPETISAIKAEERYRLEHLGEWLDVYQRMHEFRGNPDKSTLTEEQE